MYVYSIPGYNQYARASLIRHGQQLAWLIAFIASVVSKARSEFPNFAWWTLAYYLCCIVGVLIVVGSDSTQTYHVAVG